MSDAVRGHSPATLLEASGIRCDLSPTIRPAWRGARVVGPAFTVQGAGGDNLALHVAILEASRGDVLVVDAGAADFGHWGEVLTVAAQERGIAGLVIDGGVRDTAEMRGLGFPVFSNSIAMAGTRKDFGGVFRRTVHVGGRAIDQGDLIVGDVDGVVAIPRDLLPQVLTAADDRVEEERGIIERLRAGSRTIDEYAFGTAFRTADRDPSA